MKTSAKHLLITPLIAGGFVLVNALASVGVAQTAGSAPTPQEGDKPSAEAKETDKKAMKAKKDHAGAKHKSDKQSKSTEMSEKAATDTKGAPAASGDMKSGDMKSDAKAPPATTDAPPATQPK
jgi:hypothetical protein